MNGRRRCGWMLAALLAGYGLRAQDIQAQYLHVREAYAQHTRDIEQRLAKTSRELLNQFIVSLVRVEQTYKDAGDLDGVMTSRELREQTLTSSEYPEVREDYPEKIRDRIRELLEQREEARKKRQSELDALNRILIDALEPYQVEFTKRGELDTAIEILDMRKELTASLEEPWVSGSGPPEEEAQALIPADHNTYGFCLEPEVYAEVQGVATRKSAVRQIGEIRGNVEIQEKGYDFNKGMMYFPPETMTALLQGVQKNQMLTVEFALRPLRGRAGDELAPSPVLVYGNHPEDANLAITQEGTDLYLRLRTTTQPEGGLHKINLGRIRSDRAQHVMITYRNRELTVYRNGNATLKRRDVKGLLLNWEEYPVLIGGVLADETMPPSPEDESWRGVIYQFYMKATMETGRSAAETYNRFEAAVRH